MLLVGISGDSGDKESACNAGDLSQPLSWEDLLEKEMATHPSILTWRTPMDRGAWPAAVHGGRKESDMTDQLSTHYIGELLKKIMKSVYST